MGLRTEDRVQRWEKSQEIRSGKYTLWDHASSCPARTWRPSSRPWTRCRREPSATSSRSPATIAFELYDFPGGYAQRFDGIAPGGGDRASDVQNIFQDNARTVGHPDAAGDRARAVDFGPEHLPAVRRRAASSRSTGTSTATAPTS